MRRTSFCFPRSPSTAPPSWRKVKSCVESYGYCVVVVSEGVRNADGKFLAEAGTKDAFGHAQLGGVGPVVAHMTQEALGYKFHWAVADYLQRSARHIASKVDVEQAYAVGKAAVEFAVQGHQRRHADHRAQILHALPLEHRPGAAAGDRQPGKEGAARLHHAPTDSASPPACRRYLVPLIAGEAYPPYTRRPAALRHHQRRERREAPAHGLCGMISRRQVPINPYFSIT